MQPSYVPWRGTFHLIQKAEVYVFYDDVQYTKRSWRNRNRIKGPAGPRWLTIPVHAKGSITERIPIHRIGIDWDTPWNRAHRDVLHQTYRRAPHYRRYAGLLDRIYATSAVLLADFVIETTVVLARELGIDKTRFLRSSQLPAEGGQTDRVLSILRLAGADHLINGPTARAYTDEGKLERAGITLEYMTYDYPEYPQMHGTFDAQLSILDLLLMVGPRAPDYIWNVPEDGG